MSTNAPVDSGRARVRIFMPTYRRQALLPRAIASLQAQTMKDWVCEVHNDDPDDCYPGEHLAQLRDPRFTLVRHDRNLGGVATFNLFFKATPEPFYSVLEDDNWWEPDFLAEMLAAAAVHPEVEIFWANMRIWEERADGSFADTGRQTNPWTQGAQPRPVGWGQPAQIFGAIHSNGAMLVRSRPGVAYPTLAVPFVAMESFRERTFPYPLVFVPAPLANFSLTLQTHRSKDVSEWITMQTMLAATFLRHARYSDCRLRDLWSEARNATPPHTNVLIYTALIEPGCRHLFRHARVLDLLRWLRSMLRRPIITLRVLRARRRYPEWWTWLDCACADQFALSRAAR